MKFRFFFLRFILAPVALLPGHLLSNPQDANIVHGDVTIEDFGSTLQILQGSDKAIIEWGDFSIGLSEATHFLQPGSSAAVLNRVMGSNASALEGLLEANGRVFLINPNGILVGPNA
ncbi:MAG: filamentous hemagglutinin N-terminal domain-containing protein, partial [Verrucomicrobiota bacterium]